MHKENLVLIGNGMAGVRTLEELLKLAPDHYNITGFGEGPYGSTASSGISTTASRYTKAKRSKKSTAPAVKSSPPMVQLRNTTV